MATKGDISDLDHLMYGGKYLVPQVDMSSTRTTGLIQSSVAGGATRQRKKFYNTVYTQDVVYQLFSKQQMDFMTVFFERNEGKKFVGYTMADRPIVEPYVMQVTSVWDNENVESCYTELNVTLEVFSVRDITLDTLLYNIYSNYGDEVWLLWNLLKQNVEAMPDV